MFKRSVMVNFLIITGLILSPCSIKLRHTNTSGLQLQLIEIAVKRFTNYMVYDFE